MKEIEKLKKLIAAGKVTEEAAKELVAFINNWYDKQGPGPQPQDGGGDTPPPPPPHK